MQRYWRDIKNKQLKVILGCYSEDIVCKRKNRTLSRLRRSREKEFMRKEIKEYDSIYTNIAND